MRLTKEREQQIRDVHEDCQRDCYGCDLLAEIDALRAALAEPLADRILSAHDRLTRERDEARRELAAAMHSLTDGQGEQSWSAAVRDALGVVVREAEIRGATWMREEAAALLDSAATTYTLMLQGPESTVLRGRASEVRRLDPADVVDAARGAESVVRPTAP